jgi:tetratricopeptide (TPR) repeat protein
VASYLRMALDLLPAADPRRPRLLARRGLALAWSLALEEAIEAASEAGSLLAGSEGGDAAGKYLADATDAVWMAEFSPRAWQLAEEGLRHIGARRDLTWARLATHRLHARQAADPGFPGIPVDTPEQQELARVVFARWDDFLALVASGSAGGLGLSLDLVFSSREDVLARAGPLFVLPVWWAGEMKSNLPLMRAAFDGALPRGQLALAALTLATVARVESALGNLAACETAFARATELASRVQTSRFLHAQIQVVPFELALVRGEGFELLVPMIDQIRGPENRWIAAVVSTFAASVAAHLGQSEDALRALAAALPAVERAPGWAVNYTYMIHLAVHALWVLGRTDHAAVIERNLREKTVTPDFRYPHTDGRLSLARLCALQGRADEAADWFAKARAVLDEQGARPLRALADFDEAWMHGRRGAPGDRERALPLLDAAVRQFREIGMAGWLRRAEELRRALLG